jgi:hypothetical protein
MCVSITTDYSKDFSGFHCPPLSLPGLTSFLVHRFSKSPIWVMCDTCTTDYSEDILWRSFAHGLDGALIWPAGCAFNRELDEVGLGAEVGFAATAVFIQR